METTLILCRHGEKDDSGGLTGGWTDLPLTETGIRQAHLLAERLKTMAPFDVFLSSPLLRARATSDIIAAAIDQPFACDERLKEINNGDLANKSHPQWRAEFPELADSKWTAFTKFPNGEMEIEFVVRCAEFWEDVHRQNWGKKILVVSHAGVLHSILKHLAKFPFSSRNGLFFCHRPAALSRIRINDDGVIIDEINSSSHLLALE